MTRASLDWTLRTPPRFHGASAKTRRALAIAATVGLTACASAPPGHSHGHLHHARDDGRDDERAGGAPRPAGQSDGAPADPGSAAYQVGAALASSEAVTRLVDALATSSAPHDTLVRLCDDYGHRLTGSPGLEGAVGWAARELEAMGADRVSREPVEARWWIRGEESVTLVAPRTEPMHMLGLGGSVGTPADGLTAEVVTVHDEAGLEALGDAVAGKIVHFDNPMPSWTREDGACYGHTVRFRVHGARLAAAQGAVAVLVRSVTARSLRSPHTGMLAYGEAPTQIPAAAISTEDSDLLRRLAKRGQRAEVTLRMAARYEGSVTTHNVVADWKGRERPEEIVVISGHLDSWDVGQGAHDDGAGVVMAMETLRAMTTLGLRPRRTVRVVLWTNEEHGMAGVKTYLSNRLGTRELDLHVAALEADAGGFAPDGLGVSAADPSVQARAVQTVRALADRVRPLAADELVRVLPGRSAPDVGHFNKHGVPAIGLYTYGERYFDYHHTHADTVDKVDAGELARSTAVFAALTWVLAEMPSGLGSPSR